MKLLSIYCKNIDRYVEAEGGSTLLDIWRGIADSLDFTPVCAMVNNKCEGLLYPVFQPKEVQFVGRTHPAGKRVYTRSLCMMLYYAVEKAYPGTRLRLEHSISKGYYFQLEGIKSSPEVAGVLLEEMRTLAGRDIPFVREEKRTEDVIEIFRRQGLHDKAMVLRSVDEIYSVYYSLDGLCDSYYGALAPSTGMIDVFDIIPYKEGFLLMGFDPENPSHPQQPVAQEKMYKAFTDYVDFNRVLGVNTVGQLNEAVIKKQTPMVINVAEALHNKYISHISDEITDRYRNGGARIVLIAGPSSSGKTTTTKRLGVQLTTNLLKPQMISLDDYFIDREHTPRDASGDYDYESLYALDLERFNSDLNAILRGEEVSLPSYSFELGRRVDKGHKIHLDDNSILLIEGIHGLNPELTANIEERMKFRLYVSALTTISIDDHNWVPTTDNRLLRRIIRDYKYRGSSALDTIARWPSVRAGEEKWIFPYQENADATFNSSLLFELGVMREVGEKILKEVPRNTPEYAEAYRLRRILSYFLPIPSAMIPSTSVVREFLGGSSFHY